MRHHTIRFPFLALLAACTLVLVTVLPAAAMGSGLSPIDRTSVDQAVDPTEEPGDGQDVDPTEEPGDDEQEDDVFYTNTGFYCSETDAQHPFGALLARRYEMDYKDLRDAFCQGFGWGQIMLALHTIQATGVPTDTPVTEVLTDTQVIEGPATFTDLLEMRSSGMGWGQIWQELGFHGKPVLTDSPNDDDSDGVPDTEDGPDGENTDETTDVDTETAAGNGGNPNSAKKDNGKSTAPGQNKDKTNNGNASAPGQNKDKSNNGNAGGGKAKDKGKP